MKRSNGLYLHLIALLALLLPVACNEASRNPTAATPADSKVVAATAPAATTAPDASQAALNGAVAERIVDEPTRRVLRLANGLTVLLQQNKTAPVVAARVYVKAGSLTEQQYMGAGISHVLEHLVAGASSGKHNEEQNQQMLRILGGDSNAFTSYDQTCYFITTTADKWPTAMELLADWTTRAEFTPEQFAREYQVVQRELEMGEAEAMRTFYKLMAATRYQVHPAGLPVIGFKQAFQKLTWQDCQSYYRQMYVPDNMIVSVAGDLNLDDAEKIVRDNFSHMERKKVPAIALPQEPAVAAPRLAVAHADVKDARVAWAFPSVDTYSPDMYPLDVLASVLGDGESSVLVQRLRDEKQLVTGISVADDTPRYAPGSLEFVVEAEPANILKARDALLEELAKVLKDGVKTEDVEKAKVMLAANLVYGNQTAEQQAERNASDYMLTGNIDFSRVYVDRIKQVTPAQILEAARKYIKPEALLTTVLLPKGVPDSVVGLAGAAQASLEQGQAQKIKLANGLTVLLRRNTAAPLVAMQLYVTGGLLAEDDTNNGTGFAMMQLMERGTTSRSAQQIAEFFDSTGGSFSTTSGNNSFAVASQCLKENAAQTFDVFSDLILHPAFTAEELERMRPRLMAAVARSTEDWSGEGFKFLRESFFEKSPYKRMTVGTADVVGKMTVAQIRQHYETYFLNPSKAVLAIYGDIDPAEAQKWAEKFTSIPAKDSRLNTESVDKPARTVRQESKKGSASIFIGYGPGMKITSDDRYPMIVLQTILGGYNSPGGSVLHETLRGKGLVYVVQATNFAGPAPGLFMILALGEPKNATEIVQLIDQIVNDAKAGKLTDEQIATAKDQAITGEQLQDTTIAGQASDEALDECLGLGYDARTKFADRIRKVTRDDLVRVAKTYLQNQVVSISAPK